MLKRLIAIILVLAIVLTESACSDTISKHSKYSKGDYVHFGKYNWQVLKVENGNALLLSERVLEYRPYNETDKNITWADSNVRSYLNNEFLNSFDDDDKKRIIKTVIKTPDNPWDFTNQGGNAFTEGGKDTEDYIFLLSLDEVIDYFTNDGKDSMLYQAQLGKSEAKLFDGYENERKAYQLTRQLDTTQASPWFLRSPGMLEDTVAYVDPKGSISVRGIIVTQERGGIRPAMWVKDVETLEESIICRNPDCPTCNTNLYRDNYSPEKDGSCPICGIAGRECSNKVQHNRLYHDWFYNFVFITDEMLEEIKTIRDDYENAWFDIRKILDDATSKGTTDGQRTRTQLVISSSMAQKLCDFMVSEISIVPVYRSMTEKQFEEEKNTLTNRTVLLKEVHNTIIQGINEANSSAITFDQESQYLLKAVAKEILRSGVKRVSSETNEALWASGYYHALFGDEIAGMAYDEFEKLNQNEIDKLFGNNKLLEFLYEGDAMLDGYLTAIFFNGN